MRLKKLCLGNSPFQHPSPVPSFDIWIEVFQEISVLSTPPILHIRHEILYRRFQGLLISPLFSITKKGLEKLYQHRPQIAQANLCVCVCVIKVEKGAAENGVTVWSIFFSQWHPAISPSNGTPAHPAMAPSNGTPAHPAMAPKVNSAKVGS